MTRILTSAITSSYASRASSNGGVVPNGSNVTGPSLEDMEASNVELGNTYNTQSPGDVRKATGPRYLYYRIYAKDGAIASNNPIYSNDQSLSRIHTKAVAPPHTVASLKQHLCNIEGFPEDAQSCCLFALLSDQEAMDEAAPVSLFGPSGPGLSAHDPVALVVSDSDRGSATVRPENLLERPEARNSSHGNQEAMDEAANWVSIFGPSDSGISEHDPAALVVGSDRSTTLKPKNLPERPEARNPKYIYYRLYSPEGQIPSKMAFSESDNSLGRIGTHVIAPPYTVASLKACLIKSECVAFKAPFGTLQLFAVLNSETPMRDDDPLQLLTGTYPGGDEDNPMAFVVDIASMRLKAFNTNTKSFDPSWLSIVRGETLMTNGIAKSRKYNPKGKYLPKMFMWMADVLIDINSTTYRGYDAINSSGKRGFVLAMDVEFC